MKATLARGRIPVKVPGKAGRPEADVQGQRWPRKAQAQVQWGAGRRSPAKARKNRELAAAMGESPHAHD